VNPGRVEPVDCAAALKDATQTRKMATRSASTQVEAPKVAPQAAASQKIAPQANAQNVKPELKR
jgi:hypothetical protein